MAVSSTTQAGNDRPPKHRPRLHRPAHGLSGKLSIERDRGLVAGGAGGQVLPPHFSWRCCPAELRSRQASTGRRRSALAGARASFFEAPSRDYDPGMSGICFWDLVPIVPKKTVHYY